MTYSRVRLPLHTLQHATSATICSREGGGTFHSHFGHFTTLCRAIEKERGREGGKKRSRQLISSSYLLNLIVDLTPYSLVLHFMVPTLGPRQFFKLLYYHHHHHVKLSTKLKKGKRTLVQTPVLHLTSAAPLSPRRSVPSSLLFASTFNTLQEMRLKMKPHLLKNQATIK